MENEEILDEEIVKEDKNEVLDDNSGEEIRKNNDLIAKLKSLVFEDKQVEFPNRKKIKIINQIADEIIADIEYANKPSQE